jgi:putative FmdB family regulatory protein
MIRANRSSLDSRGKAAEWPQLRACLRFRCDRMSTFRHLRTIQYKRGDYRTSIFVHDAQQPPYGLVRFLHYRFRRIPIAERGTAMPLYSFHCVKCDGEVELLIGFSEKPACPACGSKRMQRLMSLTAPQGRTKALMKAGRAQAAREGHLSNFSRAERRR